MMVMADSPFHIHCKLPHPENVAFVRTQREQTEFPSIFWLEEIRDLFTIFISSIAVLQCSDIFAVSIRVLFAFLNFNNEKWLQLDRRC